MLQTATDRPQGRILYAPWHACRALMLCVSLLIPAELPADQDGEFREVPPPELPEPVFAEITSADTYTEDGVILLDCNSRLQLPGKPEAALKSGLPLEFVLHVDIIRQRSWWFDEAIASATARYQLVYHELSRQYRVHQLWNGVRGTHLNLPSALFRVGRLRGFPLIEKQHLLEDQDYVVRLRLSLDAEALPLPLRPEAYLSEQWRISSEVFQWDIR